MYDCLGEYNQAKELYKKALTIYKHIFGKNHAYVATSYSNLALAHSSLKEYNQESTEDSQKDFWWRSCWCSNMV